jgi:hypothetical protein
MNSVLDEEEESKNQMNRHVTTHNEVNLDSIKAYISLNQ